MDKRIILSVAGSGKTSFIIDQLNYTERALIITYTKNNYANIRKKVINKFGFIPGSIQIYTYFDFLYNFCYKPYLYFRTLAKGINWDIPPSFTLRLKRDDPKFYMDSSRRLYYNRIAKLLEVNSSYDKIKQRIEKYFDYLFIDEVQDFGGHDFNLLMNIVNANVRLCLVGDFYQHTFETSNDGNVNSNLYSDFDKYKRRLAAKGISIDCCTLSNSFRCSPSVCKFVETNFNISISSHCKEDTKVEFVDNPDLVNKLFLCNETVKLFYQNHHKYPCFSENWGASKGIDSYQDVCVVLNKSTYDLFKKNRLSEMNEKTKNKFYVACTRARGNLYFIPEALLKCFIDPGI